MRDIISVLPPLEKSGQQKGDDKKRTTKGVTSYREWFCGRLFVVRFCRQHLLSRPAEVYVGNGARGGV